MRKQILAIVLSFCMLVMLVPTAVFAADTKTSEAKISQEGNQKSRSYFWESNPYLWPWMTTNFYENMNQLTAELGMKPMQAGKRVQEEKLNQFMEVLQRSPYIFSRLMMYSQGNLAKLLAKLGAIQNPNQTSNQQPSQTPNQPSTGGNSGTTGGGTGTQNPSPSPTPTPDPAPNPNPGPTPSVPPNPGTDPTPPTPQEIQLTLKATAGSWVNGGSFNGGADMYHLTLTTQDMKDVVNLTKGDKVYVWVYDAKTNELLNQKSNFTVGANGNLEGDKIYFPKNGNAVNVYALRTDAELTEKSLQEGFTHAIKASQNEATDYAASSLLYASRTNVTQTRNAVELEFQPLLSKVKVTLKTGDGLKQSDLDNATVKLVNSNTKASVDLKNESMITSVDSKQDITMHKVAGPHIYEALVIPQSLANQSITIDVNGTTYSWSIPEDNNGWSVGSKYTYEVTVKREALSITVSSIGWGTDGASGSGSVGSGSVEMQNDGISLMSSENTNDGNSSVWEENDMFYVKFEGSNDIGTYKIINATAGTVEAVKPVYWPSASEEQTIIAWYDASQSGMIDVSNQTDGLAYVIRAEQKATYNSGSPVSLQFSHQLAKVRVLLDGTQVAQAETVEVMGYTSCTHTQGAVTAGDTQNWFKMKRTTYDNDIECWEACVLPGNIDLTNFIRLNGTTVVNDLSGISETLEGGKMYTIDLTVGEPITDITSVNCKNINDDRGYRVKGSFGQTITVTGGSPTIYLENADIATSDIGIYVKSGKATIHVKGNCKVVSTGERPGIFAEENCTVTITGDSRENKLTVKGGMSSPGIGGYSESVNCGNIKICNVIVCAFGGDRGTSYPGIGGYMYGTITIQNATVYAYGSQMGSPFSTPGIGGLFSIPTIQIEKESMIYAYRGGSFLNCDYIGRSQKTNDINFGSGGYCKSSTIYCYTGNKETLTPDKTVVYDNNGNRQ